MNNDYEDTSHESSIRMTPDFHQIVKSYEEQMQYRKSLIHICGEIGSCKFAKIIIDRILHGVGRHQDILDKQLEIDNVQDGENRVEILREYVNRKDYYGIAPIHLAAHSGNITMIKLLCANEADPFLRTDDGLTVIHSAAEGDSVNSIYYFHQQYGMDVDVRDDKNCTSLHWAVIEGHEVAATYLLAWGANVNAQDALGNTPLHLSVGYAEKELNTRLVKILLLRGADRNIRNNDHLTAKEVCRESEVRDELLK